MPKSVPQVRPASRSAPPAPPAVEIPSPAALLALYAPPIQGPSDQVTAIIARIVEKIRKGELAAGQRLIEAVLTAEFGVVRGRVREGLLILAGEGLVELAPQRGARVASLDRGGLVEYLEVLEAISSKGMELFVRRFGKPGGDVAQALNDAFDRIAATGANDPFAAHQRAVEFHVLVNHLSGNPLLNHAVARLGIVLYQGELATQIATNIRRYVVDPHHAMLQALIAGDDDGAARALRLYVQLLANHMAGANENLR